MSEDLPSPSLHGLGFSEADGNNRFRFATARFIKQVYWEQIGPRKAGEARPSWPDKWIDRAFGQASAKFSDTLGKLDLVADWFARDRNRFGDWARKEEAGHPTLPPDYLRHIPIYLDSLLVYLRVLADVIANVTPNLYGNAAGHKISPRSFRDQRTWFTKTRPDFDSAYTEILNERTEWFDLLAGKKGRGLREVAVHFRGVFQTSYVVDPPERRGEISPGLVGDYGWVSSDVVPELRTVVHGFCLFLDCYVNHFNDRIFAETGWRPLDLSVPHLTELYRFSSPLPSFWLYPTCESSLDARDRIVAALIEDLHEETPRE